MLNRLIPFKYKRWFSLVSCLAIQLSLGSYFTFGNFQPYFISYLREYEGCDVRYSQSIWFSTVNGVLMTLFSLIGGVIHSRFKVNIKFILLIGCMLLSFGTGLTSYTMKISPGLTLVTYSIITGIGIGLAYVGPFSIVMKWFSDSKGLANAAVLFGYGVSAVIFNEIQTKYINPDNYSPDKPYSDKFPDEKYYSKLHSDLLERVPKCMLLISGICICMQIPAILFLSIYEDEVELETANESSYLINESPEDKIEKISTQDVPETNSLGIKYNLPNEGMSCREAIKTPAFWIISIMSTFSTTAAINVVSFFKIFGETFIDNDNFLTITGSAGSICGAFAKFGWGFLIDRVPSKVCILICQTLMIVTVSTVYFTKLLAIKELYFLWIVLIYTSTVGILVFSPTMIAKTFGQKNFTAIYGIIMLTNLVSTVTNLALTSSKDHLGWFWYFFLGCCLSLLSWIAGFAFNVKKGNGEDI